MIPRLRSLSGPRRRRWLALALLPTLLASCGAPPGIGASLAYALIINSGRADLTGYTLEYTVQADPWRLDHRTRGDVLVEAITLAETVRDEPLPVRSNEQGLFRFRELPDGEPVFMRGRFSDRPKRIAYTFGRPRVPTECAAALEFTPKRRIQNHPAGADCELSLASTVLARAIARSDWLPESFEPHLAPQLMGLLWDRLVLMIPVLAAEAGMSPEAFIDAFLSQERLADAQAGWVGSIDVVKRIIWDDPELTRLVSELGQAWLNVTFSLQAVGDNRATYPGERLPRHVARGPARLVCTLPPDAPAFVAITFWLNNEQVAVAERRGLTWQARIETSERPDGPYAVTAQGRTSPAAAPVTLGKAFLYIDNQRKLKGCL